MTFIVQVDDRESAGPVAEALRLSSDFHVTVSRLRTGDYLVDGRLLFERKTFNDLMLSIIDGRLFAQALRLARASFRPAIILEGRDEEVAQSAMRWESIQGALITVSLFFGVPVLRTHTPAETVRTMLYAAQQAGRVAAGSLPRHSYRPRGKRGLQLFILQGLPGIGPTRARRLLDRFGSVQGVIRALPDELQSVKGFGKVQAGKIRWAVEEPPPDYKEARPTSV